MELLRSWSRSILLICLNLIYNSTLGPVCYTLISEVGSTRLRQKTVVLARISYQIMNIICGIIGKSHTSTLFSLGLLGFKLIDMSLLIHAIVPRMLSPDAWNLRSKSAFVFVSRASSFLKNTAI
jgi:hypothetical protein